MPRLQVRHFILILIFSGIVIFPGISNAQTNAGYAGSYLRMGLGARGISMANTLPSGSRDVFGFFYNPAVLPTMETRHFGTTYGFLPLDRLYNYIGFAMPLPPTAGIGLGWFSTGVDDIQGRGFSGQKIETYSVRQHTYMVSFGNQFSKQVSTGVLLKLLRNDLQEVTASTVGIDLGVIYSPHPRVKIGAAAQHFNAGFSWDTEDVYSQGSTVVNTFPVIYRAGAQIQVLDDLTVLGEYERSDKGAVVFRGAAEWQPIDLTQVRFGIADREVRFGGGLEYGFIGSLDTALDYAVAFGRAGEGASHYFSWSFQF